MFSNVPSATGPGVEDFINPVKDAGGTLQFYSYVMDTIIEFEAFLTSYSDSFNSNWNSENVYGRMDPIHTFQNTQRTLGVSFTIPNVADKKQGDDGVPVTKEWLNMHKLNQFFQFLYPKYAGADDNALTISQAPLVRMKFGNMIANSADASDGWAPTTGLLVAITSISMTPKIEHGFSKIVNGQFSGQRSTLTGDGVEAIGSEVSRGQTFIYPNFIDLSVACNVIHEQDKLFSGERANAGFPYGQFAGVAGFMEDGAPTDEVADPSDTDAETADGDLGIDLSNMAL